jgi:hypothetical protein
MENPFYSSGADTKPPLNNASYSEEDLPPLPERVPVTVANLIHNLLERNPSKVRNITHVFRHKTLIYLKVSFFDAPYIVKKSASCGGYIRSSVSVL